jgi:hypothetical protein
MFEMLAHSASLEKRIQAVEKLEQLPHHEHFLCSTVLFDTPCHDLWEAVLDTCTTERVSSDEWQRSLSDYLNEKKGNLSARVQQSLVICIRRIEGKLSEVFKDFYHQCLQSEDMDVRYQAFCLAELQEESSAEYVEFVKNPIKEAYKFMEWDYDTEKRA